MSGVVEGDDTINATFLVHIDVVSVVVCCVVVLMMMTAGGVELIVVSGTGFEVWLDWFVIGRSAHVTLSITCVDADIGGDEQCSPV